MTYVNDKLLWALTVEAEYAITAMEAYGLDRDLALTVLEQLWAEQEIYDLPARDEVNA